MCPLLYGWEGHLLLCDPVEWREGASSRPARPFQYKSSIDVFTELYGLRDLALPYSFRELNGDDHALGAEHLVGSLAPWAPPQSASKPAPGLRMLCDGVVDDLGDGEVDDEFGDDVGNGLDDEIGPQVPLTAVSDAAASATVETAHAMELFMADSDPFAQLDDPLGAIEDAFTAVAELGGDESHGLLVPVPGDEVERYDVALETWRAAVTLSYDVVQEISRQDGAAIPPSTGRMSLLAYSHPVTKTMQASFIHWVNPELRKRKKGVLLQGRQVITRAGCVVYSIPSAFPIIEFTTTEHFVILADVGVAMDKVRKAERPAMGSMPLRAQTMFETAYSIRASQADADTTEPMMTVGKGDCVACLNGAGGGEAPTTCAVCLVTYHGTCRRRVVQHAKSTSWFSSIALGPTLQIPTVFDTCLCELCEASKFFELVI